MLTQSELQQLMLDLGKHGDVVDQNHSLHLLFVLVLGEARCPGGDPHASLQVLKHIVHKIDLSMPEALRAHLFGAMVHICTRPDTSRLHALCTKYSAEARCPIDVSDLVIFLFRAALLSVHVSLVSDVFGDALDNLFDRDLELFNALVSDIIEFLYLFSKKMDLNTVELPNLAYLTDVSNVSVDMNDRVSTSSLVLTCLNILLRIVSRYSSFVACQMSQLRQISLAILAGPLSEQHLNVAKNILQLLVNQPWSSRLYFTDMAVSSVAQNTGDLDLSRLRLSSEQSSRAAASNPGAPSFDDILSRFTVQQFDACLRTLEELASRNMPQFNADVIRIFEIRDVVFQAKKLRIEHMSLDVLKAFACLLVSDLESASRHLYSSIIQPYLALEPDTQLIHLISLQVCTRDRPLLNGLRCDLLKQYPPSSPCFEQIVNVVAPNAERRIPYNEFECVPWLLNAIRSFGSDKMFISSFLQQIDERVVLMCVPALLEFYFNRVSADAACELGIALLSELSRKNLTIDAVSAVVKWFGCCASGCLEVKPNKAGIVEYSCSENGQNTPLPVDFLDALLSFSVGTWFDKNDCVGYSRLLSSLATVFEHMSIPDSFNLFSDSTIDQLFGIYGSVRSRILRRSINAFFSRLMVSLPKSDKRSETLRRVKELRNANANDGDLSFAIAKLFCYFGQHSNDRTFVGATILNLVDFLDDRNAFLCSSIVAAIHEISSTSAVLESLFDVEPALAQVCMERMTNSTFALSVVSRFIFGMMERDFVRKNLEHTLPRLVLKENTDAINTIADYVQTHRSILLLESSHDILAAIFLQKNASSFESSTLYLLDLISGSENRDPNTKYTLLQVTGACLHNLVMKLCLELGDDRATRSAAALTGLEMVIKVIRDAGNHRQVSIDDFLSRFLLGYLHYVTNDILLAKLIPTWTKKKALRSICQLIKLMKHRIQNVAIQVLKLLENLQNDVTFHSLLAHIWDAFVRAIRADISGEFCGVVIANLVQFWNRYKNSDIRGCLEHVVREWRHVSDPVLFRIMRACLDDGIGEGWQHITMDVDSGVELPLVIPYIRSDNSILISQALRYTGRLLISIRHSHYLFPELITTLIETIKRFPASTEIIGLVAICFSRIGAVDVRLNSGKPPAVSVETLVDDYSHIVHLINFVVDLTQFVLYPNFKSAMDTKSQEKYAYVLQELMAVCQFGAISKRSSNDATLSSTASHRLKRWFELPDSVRNGLEPLFTSKYSIQESTNRIDGLPIYGSNYGCTHDLWVRRFAICLVDRLGSDRARKVFVPCKVLLKGASGDTKLAEFLLPNLVLSVLTQGKDQETSSLIEELTSVLGMRVRLNETSIIDLENTRVSSEAQLSCSVVFRVLDVLEAWVIRRSRQIAVIHSQRSRRPDHDFGSGLEVTLAYVQKVQIFLSLIPPLLIARAAFMCSAYERAVKYLVNAIKLQPRVTALLEEFQLICAHMGDADSMRGISVLLRNCGVDFSLNAQIREYRCLGNWMDAQACYETGLSLFPDCFDYKVGLLESLTNLGHSETVLAHVQRNEWATQAEFEKFGSQAAYRLGRWDVLESLSKKTRVSSFETDVGKALVALGTDFHLAQQRIGDAFANIHASLKAAVSASSQEQRLMLLRLQILDELESFTTADRTPEGLACLLESWNAKEVLMDSTYYFVEPCLSTRRAALARGGICFNVDESMLASSICLMWLKSAKSARRTGLFQTAAQSLWRARLIKTDSTLNLFKTLESSKLLVATGQTTKAIINLEAVAKTTKAQFDEDPSNVDVYSRKCVILLGKLLLDHQPDKIRHIKSTLELGAKLCTDSDKPWFLLGKFGDRLLAESEERMETRPKTAKGKSNDTDLIEVTQQYVEQLAFTVRAYARASIFGSKFVFHALPRCLTLWLDFTEAPRLIEGGDKLLKLRDHANQALNSIAATLQRRCPIYNLLLVFPQLTSRMCHPDNSVWTILSHMIFRVLKDFPQQALWLLMFMSKSSRKQRSERCVQLLQSAKSIETLRGLVKQATALTDQLLYLCDYDIPDKTLRLSLSEKFPGLKALNSLDLILPIQASLTPSLPIKGVAENHRPFSDDLPRIVAFEEQISVMTSLQKPRKIGVKGSDGRVYHFLCKPKDDMRKDSRLLEFFGVINKLFARGEETRHRQLSISFSPMRKPHQALEIKTYAVTPLNEECGLIEWVPNTNTLRSILTSQYKTRGIGIPAQKLREWKDLTSNPQKQLEYFQNDLLSVHSPPVFGDWLLQSFVEPSSWLAAQRLWTKSVAVMSIVGFVVGLGDRHTENILVDEQSAEALHVDFNCLFDKGLTFDYAERVPFRLTHNVVEGFGLAKTEGLFRVCCDIVMKLLRENRGTLLSVLESFVHDPLVEWSKKTMKQDSPDLGRRVLKTIDRKLDGYLGLLYEYNEADKIGATTFSKNVVSYIVGKPRLMPTKYDRKHSPEGQVDELIDMAQDVALLSRMWIGWAAYM